jgi:hypothetical protein
MLPSYSGRGAFHEAISVMSATCVQSGHGISVATASVTYGKASGAAPSGAQRGAKHPELRGEKPVVNQSSPPLEPRKQHAPLVLWSCTGDKTGAEPPW